MQKQLLILDLFCCSGISSEGYLVNGHRVVGIDHKRPSFHPSHFIEYDIRQLSTGFLKQFDYIASSPPCQEYSRLAALSTKYANGGGHLIEFTRDLISRSGVPGHLENVCQAPIAKDLVLCGCMFNAKLIRRRAFEFVNWLPFHSPPVCKCNERNPDAITIAGKSNWSKVEAANVYGIKHMRTRSELAEAIPPFYAAYVIDLFERHTVTGS